MIGQTFGPFRVLEKLGEGGMGEVYRAHDTKLGRDVALKILPRPFTSDPDRLARFEREARVLASLNHPHIGAIYGVEESNGVRALVLELVQGETLADRIARGPVPLDEALSIATQIAEALDAAHERGVIHRDLKPANIKTASGVVKVLDFGLAKAAAGDTAMPGPVDSDTAATVSTRAGVILGTAAYMSPEQARGQVVDKRTDIWAFGCVLFEMLTGRAVFARDTFADTLAAVVEQQPHWTGLPPATPQGVRRLLGRCLDKDLKRRVRDAGDVRYELEQALAGVAAPGVADLPQHPSASRARWPRWAAGALGLTVGAAALWWQLEPSDALLRNPLEGAAYTRLTDFEGAEHHATISRDGKFVAFLSERDGPWDAWVSQVGTGEVHNLTNGRAGVLRNPAVRTLAFSPDGALVTIWNRLVDPAKGVLVDGGWAVPALGGQLRPYLPGIAELDWSPDGRRIVYHPSSTGDPLFVTDGDERTGQQIYAAQEGVHNHFPIWSPDGAYVYFVQGYPLDEMDVWRIRPTGGTPERMTYHNARVSFPTFLDSRTLVYLSTSDDGSGPWIHALDVEDRVTRRISTGIDEYVSLSASSDGRRLVATVSESTASLWRADIGADIVEESGAARISLPTTRGVSPRIGPGYLVYRAPRAGTDGLWKVADETPLELWRGLEGRVVGGASIEPNGARIAFTVQRQGRTGLYVTNADGTGGGARPLADELDVRGSPDWSPDGQWIAIAADQGGEPRLFKIPTGGGAPVPLVADYSTDPVWAPSGQFLVYSGADVGTTFPVRAVSVDGTPYDLPTLVLSRGARRLAFAGGDDTLIVLKGDILHKEFWSVDLRTGRERQLTDFGQRFTIGDFDLSADGREVVFDRARDESDIVLIDLPGR